MLAHKPIGPDGGTQSGSGRRELCATSINPQLENQQVVAAHNQSPMPKKDIPDVPLKDKDSRLFRGISGIAESINFDPDRKRSIEESLVLQVSVERRSGEFPVPWVRWYIHGGSIKVFRPNSLPWQLLRRLYMPAAEARYSVIQGDGVSPVRVKEGDVVEVSTPSGPSGLKYYRFDVHSVDADTDSRKRRGMPNLAGANLRLSPGDNVAFTPRKAPEMLKKRGQLDVVPPLQVKKAPKKQ